MAMLQRRKSSNTERSPDNKLQRSNNYAFEEKKQVHFWRVETKCTLLMLEA